LAEICTVYIPCSVHFTQCTIKIVLNKFSFKIQTVVSILEMIFINIIKNKDEDIALQLLYPNY